MGLLTVEQDAFLRKEYRRLSRRDVTAALNKRFGLDLKISQIVSYTKNHKITSGRTGRFQPGNIPLPSARPKGPNKTSFKKGSRPTNYRPIGHERIDKKDGYILVKVAERNPWNDNPSGWYRHKHVVLWEQHHGPVPEGMCVRFLDGDRLNVTLDNLVLVSRGVHARLTVMGFSDQHAEVKPALIGLARLDQAISERTSKEQS